MISPKTTLPKINRRLLASRVLLALAVVAVFFAGVLTGGNFVQTKQDLDLKKFWQVYNLMQKDYVYDVDKTAAAEGAVKGLVASLNDPYSAYLPAEDRKNLEDELSGQFEGIGAELTDKDGQVVVVAPMASSPAEAAGIKAGDIIVSVDDKSTEGLTLNAVVKLIRGTKGTTVKVTIVRGTSQEEKTFTITRDTITVKSVEWAMKSGNVGYIKISQFGDDTVALTQEAVKEIAKKNPKAVIIDLRNNPGGYLNDVAPIAGLFLPPSVVVKEKYRLGKEDEIRSTTTPVLPSTSLYVLTNGGSASAAEILSGALQDYKRAKLVGQKTFGKGCVQNVIDLSDSSALRITIAEWLTPNGRAINKVGIEPDIKVDQDKDAATGKDPILEKAFELINQ